MEKVKIRSNWNTYTEEPLIPEVQDYLRTRGGFTDWEDLTGYIITFVEEKEDGIILHLEKAK